MKKIYNILLVLLLLGNTFATQNSNENNENIESNNHEDFVLKDNNNLPLKKLPCFLATIRGAGILSNNPRGKDLGKKAINSALNVFRSETNTKKVAKSMFMAPLVVVDYLVNTPAYLVFSKNEELAQKIHCKSFEKTLTELNNDNVGEALDISTGVLLSIHATYTLLKSLGAVFFQNLKLASRLKLFGVKFVGIGLIIGEKIGIGWLGKKYEHPNIAFAASIATMLITQIALMYILKLYTDFLNKKEQHVFSDDQAKFSKSKIKNTLYKLFLGKKKEEVNVKLTFGEKLSLKAPKTYNFFKNYGIYLKIGVGLVFFASMLGLATWRVKGITD